MTNNKSDDRQFLKFAILMCVSGVFFSTLGGVLWTNFSSIGDRVDVPTPTVVVTEVQDKSVTFSAISGATSDLDVSPKPWWIWNSQSVFELSNQSTRPQVVSLKLSLGLNPCGFEATGKLSIGNSLQVLTSVAPLSLTIKMKANSKLSLPLTVDSYACSIDSDPRIFLASLSSAISYHSPNEFHFER